MNLGYQPGFIKLMLLTWVTNMDYCGWSSSFSFNKDYRDKKASHIKVVVPIIVAGDWFIHSATNICTFILVRLRLLSIFSSSKTERRKQ